MESINSWLRDKGQFMAQRKSSIQTTNIFALVSQVPSYKKLGLGQDHSWTHAYREA
jgi:hypothetical protein